MSSSGKMIFTGLKKEKPSEAPPIPKVPKRLALRLTNSAFLFLVFANIGLSGYMLTKAERRSKRRNTTQQSHDQQLPPSLNGEQNYDRDEDNNTAAGNGETVFRQMSRFA